MSFSFIEYNSNLTGEENENNYSREFNDFLNRNKSNSPIKPRLLKDNYNMGNINLINLSDNISENNIEINEINFIKKINNNNIDKKSNFSNRNSKINILTDNNTNSTFSTENKYFSNLNASKFNSNKSKYISSKNNFSNNERYLTRYNKQKIPSFTIENIDEFRERKNESNCNDNDIVKLSMNNYNENENDENLFGKNKKITEVRKSQIVDKYIKNLEENKFDIFRNKFNDKRKSSIRSSLKIRKSINKEITNESRFSLFENRKTSKFLDKDSFNPEISEDNYDNNENNIDIHRVKFKKIIEN